jgi:hypothetical protein
MLQLAGFGCNGSRAEVAVPRILLQREFGSNGCASAIVKVSFLSGTVNSDLALLVKMPTGTAFVWSQALTIEWISVALESQLVIELLALSLSAGAKHVVISRCPNSRAAYPVKKLGSWR